MSSGSKYNIVWKNLILFFVSNLSYLLVYIFIVEIWKLIYLFTNLEVTFKIFQCPLEFELKTGFFINVYVIDDHFKFWFFSFILSTFNFLYYCPFLFFRCHSYLKRFLSLPCSSVRIAVSLSIAGVLSAVGILFLSASNKDVNYFPRLILSSQVYTSLCRNP